MNYEQLAVDIACDWTDDEPDGIDPGTIIMILSIIQMAVKCMSARQALRRINIFRDRRQDARKDEAALAVGSLSKIGRDVVMRVPVTVQVVLGKLRLPVAELMQLKQGSVLALDRSLGEPVDLVVNGHLVARGQIIVVEDKSKRFGISLTEVVDGAVVA